MSKVATKKKVISGLAFHCHHDILVEWVTDYKERAAYIKENKPPDEKKLRLRLFKMIPIDRWPYSIVEARAELTKAEAELTKARAVTKARAEWNKAEAEWDKARAEFADYFNTLHAELCPKCPWDGKTIFSHKEE